MRQPVALDSPTLSTRLRCLLFAALFAAAPAWCESPSAPGEVFEFGDFALYVPADSPTVLGVFLALGGPDTRAFLTDGLFEAPNPELEDSLHVLGQALRALAANHGLVMIGTTRQGKVELPNQAETDQLIFEAIAEAARLSDRPELASAPVFVYGISGGSPQAMGFTARNPQRVGALLLKVAAPSQPLSHAEALAVPTYIVLAEHDTIVMNPAAIAAFESNRGAGGLWALAMEPGVPHHSLTPGHRGLVINWLEAIVGLRLGNADQEPLQAIPESAGWLGHPEFGVWDWASYPGDRRAASWFPSRATAEEWWQFSGGSETR